LLHLNDLGYICSEEIGVNIRVVSGKKDCTNEIKKKGLLIDRHCDLELRIGDLLVVYFSKGGQ
jgi:hypothetical protein